MDTFLESFDEFVSQTSTVLGKLEQTEDTNDKLNLEIKSFLEENQECRNLNVLLTKKLNDKDLELQLVRRKYNERIEEEGGDITARAELVNTKHEVCLHPKNWCMVTFPLTHRFPNSCRVVGSYCCQSKIFRKRIAHSKGRK